MKNTLENKAKFFALYWGQPIAIVTKGSCTHPLGLEHLVDKNTISSVESEKYTKHRYSLELKPLSSISDYEAIETAKIVCPEMFQFAGNDPIKIERQSEWLTVWRRRNIHSVDIDFLGYTTCQNEDIEYKRNSVGTTHAVDYLRSRGYALPWMSLSVEQLIEYGWIKLKQNENL